ncbi:MAG: polyamine ABC transporter substrate-binding protein [Beijerinckiaceae bacterium]|jgi:putrescine transport system substrate-binding protein|nr:polyamine ABC transporter substrate-binding protein [Beijerinckiaceae bacterium]
MNRFWLVISAALLVSGGAHAQDKVVHVYNWSDYIDTKALDEFTRETGIKVVYDTYESNEMLETKLLAGNTGYDVVLPSGTFLQRQIAAGVFQPLDRSKLPNAKGLWPEVMKRLEAYDPGNRFAVNYMWFTTGIAYNVDKIKQRLGNVAVDSWDIVFRPELLKRLSDCGVYVLDSPEDLFAVAMRYLNIDPNSKKPDDIRRAATLLGRLRANVKKFHSSEYINSLANGDICLAVGWAGDAFQAKNRAREASNGIDVAYVIPREGTLMSFDNFAIPKDAPHVAEAYAFIDFMLRPEVAARNSSVTNFANGVLASKPFVEKSVIENPAIYPDEVTMKRLFTVSPNDLATQRLVTREWTRVKTGR